MVNQEEEILRRVFGYASFRPLQERVIGSILGKRDTLVIMPTGGGKSLCYQIPALIFPGLTVVVSPLISLMKDQVESLVQNGVRAVFLNSSLSPDRYRANMNEIREGRAKLLYVAPESLLRDNLLMFLREQRVDCVAIDEAHCISEWGHDFRPEYRQLASLKPVFTGAVWVALTATATEQVRNDIRASLALDRAGEFISSFNRENLFIEVKEKNDPMGQTMTFLEKFPDQSGIIYCFTRRRVDELYEVLKEKGFSVKPYHAGLSEEDRSRNQELFIRDDVQIIVATVAFGMGIDKPNVRFVVHYDLPKNIESYYQEIGRAGRDNLRSHCLLLFGYGDIRTIRFFMKEKSEHEKKVEGLHLSALLRFAETEECRRIPLLSYFGETYPGKNCRMCDNCVSEKSDKIDITIPAQKFLSCVKRTEERFGINHVVDVLRGSTAKKIFRFGHDKLSTYGIGKEFSQKQWLHLARQFLHKGLMVQNMEIGNLALTPLAWEVFRGREKVLGRIGQEPSKAPSSAASGKKDLEGLIDGYDKALFDTLKKERKKIADGAGVPPYVIFSDRSLMEMAFYLPHSEESFLFVHGVGATKLEKYGRVFLEMIRDYAGEHDLGERQNAGRVKKTETLSKPRKKRRHTEIGECLNKGETADSIMERFNIKRVTLVDHLFKFVQEGFSLESKSLLSLTTLSEEKIGSVVGAFKEKGVEFLKPAHDLLNGEIDYDELKIIRLYLLNRELEKREGASEPALTQEKKSS